MSFLPNRRKLQLFLDSFERKKLSHISPLPRNMTHRIGVTNPGNDEIREIHSRFDRRRLRGGNASIKWRWGGARVERTVMTRRRSVPRDYRRQARQSFRNYECEGKQRARRRASQHDGNKSRRDWSPLPLPLLLLFHPLLPAHEINALSIGGERNHGSCTSWFPWFPSLTTRSIDFPLLIFIVRTNFLPPSFRPSVSF